MVLDKGEVANEAISHAFVYTVMAVGVNIVVGGMIAIGLATSGSASILVLGPLALFANAVVLFYQTGRMTKKVMQVEEPQESDDTSQQALTQY